MSFHRLIRMIKKRVIIYRSYTTAAAAPTGNPSVDFQAAASSSDFQGMNPVIIVKPTGPMVDEHCCSRCQAGNKIRNYKDSTALKRYDQTAFLAHCDMQVRHISGILLLKSFKLQAGNLGLEFSNFLFMGAIALFRAAAGFARTAAEVHDQTGDF